MKQYNYKVVGVTFKSRDGSDRQKTLRELFKEDMELDNTFHTVKLEGYEFEGDDALAVLLDDREVGNIPADKVQEVAEIGQKADNCTVTLTLNGRDWQDAKDIIEMYHDRNEMVKEGIWMDSDVDRAEDAYNDLMSGNQIYGAVLHFQIMEPEDLRKQKETQERWEQMKAEEEKAKIKNPIRPLFMFTAIFTGLIGFILGIGTIAEDFSPGITIAFLIFVAGFILSIKNIRRPKK